MRLSVLFLLWPLVEIALFVTVGGQIGLIWTLAVIFGTALLGLYILRSRGLRSMGEMRQSFGVVRGGLAGLADGVLVLLSGVLLILPGFLTDVIGLLLLLPPVRLLILAMVARRVVTDVRTRAASRHSAPDEPWQSRTHTTGRPNIVIDGDYIEVEPDPKRPPSGWTRH